MPRLYAESFAPWCEKARWALDHHGVAYDATEHVPMLGELALRIAARRLRGLVTVPLLVDGDEVIMSSLGIARYAERAGHGAPLFPSEREAEIEAWNERSEVLMTAGRAMLLPRLARSTEAVREQIPSFLPRALRGPLQPLAASGVRYVMRKYGIRPGEDRDRESRARVVLDGLRATLESGNAHLLGAFSFADITMACALQFVLPVADRYIALGPATREAWTHATLASEYADLLAWRDALYERHRAPRATHVVSR